MNETPNTPSSVPTPEAASVSEALTTLQLQLQAILIILIMLSGALNLYFYRQYSLLRKEQALLEPQVAQLNDGYQRATIPLMSKFLSQLTDYANAHPDFKPILDKYPFRVASTSAVPATAQPTAAAPSSAATKQVAPAKAPAATPTKTPAAATAPKK
jgi:hypothetical protein